ncbi:uncharacterized [Tachysurus ichikawai]
MNSEVQQTTAKEKVGQKPMAAQVLTTALQQSSMDPPPLLLTPFLLNRENAVALYMLLNGSGPSFPSLAFVSNLPR